MSISLLHPLRDIPLAFIDVETTGASARLGDRVTEIGIVRTLNGNVLDELQQLVDPQRYVSAQITALTGITNDMVRGQPLFEAMIPRISNMLEGAVVIGHNVPFDLAFVRSEYTRCNQILPLVALRTHILDTVRIARKRFGRGGNGLQRLAARLQVQPTGAHRALADAHTTRLVFEKLIEPIGAFSATLLEIISAQGGPMVTRVSSTAPQVGSA